MAHVTFIEPIANLTGKVMSSSNVSHRTSYGIRHTYTWNPDTVIQPTTPRLIHREALSEASAQASAILASENHTGPWHKAYYKSGYAGPINSFIVSKLLPDIKARLTSEWQDRPLSELQDFVASQRAERIHRRR